MFRDLRLEGLMGSRSWLEGRGRPTKASFNVVAVKAYFVHEAGSKRQLTVRCVVVTVMIF